MDIQTARRLCALNTDFYQNHFDSFSVTRAGPWRGWKQCLDVLRDHWISPPNECTVLDLACGNLRFEEYVSTSLPAVDFRFHAVDNCDALAQTHQGLTVEFSSRDLITPLLSAATMDSVLNTPPADLTVSFGFLHHIPGEQFRLKFLDFMLQRTTPGGLVIVSLWQFMNDQSRNQIVRDINERALGSLDLPPLDNGDYLLGWQNQPNAYRYCHNFSESEINRLVSALSSQAELVTRFVADGKTNNLNTYLVFKQN